MPAFRNQDVTENLIIATASELSVDNMMSTVNATIWNEACDKVYGDMVAEGLLTTAEQVKNYRVSV